MKTLSFLVKRTRFYLLALFLAVPQLAAAETIPNIAGQGKDGKNPDALVVQFGFLSGTPDSANSILGSVWTQVIDRILLPLLGAIALLYIIYAGIQYVTARGNAEATKKARQTIINVLLGIVILVATYTIIGLIVGLANHFAGVVG